MTDARVRDATRRVRGLRDGIRYSPFSLRVLISPVDRLAFSFMAPASSERKGEKRGESPAEARSHTAKRVEISAPRTVGREPGSRRARTSLYACTYPQMDNACVSSATLVLLSGDDGRVDAQAEWPGRCTRHGFFRCSKKLRVKSVAGHRRGPTLFSVLNGQSVISKFGRPFILDSFSPETAPNRLAISIGNQTDFHASQISRHAAEGNRRFRKASESIPRSRSEKCRLSRENALRFPPRRGPFARPLGCVTNPETLSRRVHLVFGIIAPRYLGRPPPPSRTPARTPSPARSSPPPRADRPRRLQPRHPRVAGHPS